VFGVIRVFDKDIQNSKDNKQAFINHLDDEVTQIAKDVMKHMNIMTYGDGTGTLDRSMPTLRPRPPSSAKPEPLSGSSARAICS
jgi:hypothetical protein